MAITNVQDLRINNEYYLYIGKDFKGKPLKPRKIRLLGIVQEFKHSELYVGNLKTTGKQADWLTNIWGIHESGIGKTEQEAIENYCKLIDCKLPMAYESQEAIHHDLVKSYTAPNKYTYLNRKIS